ATASDTVTAFVPGMHGAGKAHEVFTRRANGEHFHLAWLAVTNGVIGLLGVLPPQVCGRFDLSTVLMHQQIHRLRRATSNRNRFKPSAFLHGCEHTAKGTVEKQASERRFRADETARRPGDRRISCRANGKDQHILWRQGINARSQTFIEEPDGKTITTQ